MPQPPCLKCQDRIIPSKENPGRCHDKCEKYQEWKSYDKALKEKVQSRKKEERDYDATVLLYRGEKFARAREQEMQNKRRANYGR